MEREVAIGVEPEQIKSGSRKGDGVVWPQVEPGVNNAPEL